MRLCGKRLFTPAYKGESVVKCGSAIAGPHFFWRGRRVILQGVLGKTGVFSVVFCGEVVVSCW